jgi:hypothetical protein
MDLRRLVTILRKRLHISPILRELADEIIAQVPCDGFRLDLTDEKGGMWSRIVRKGEEPQRPELGAVTRLKSKELFEVTESEGVHQVVIPLGLGETASGRWTIRRRSGAFVAVEIDALRAIADLLSLSLRNRPFDPPGRSMRFGEDEGNLV